VSPRAQFVYVCFVLLVLTVVSKGQLDSPCLSGGICSVTNSLCTAGVCLCLPQFYHRDNACRAYSTHFVAFSHVRILAY